MDRQLPLLEALRSGDLEEQLRVLVAIARSGRSAAPLAGPVMALLDATPSPRLVARACGALTAIAPDSEAVAESLARALLRQRKYPTGRRVAQAMGRMHSGFDSMLPSLLIASIHRGTHSLVRRVVSDVVRSIASTFDGRGLSSEARELLDARRAFRNSRGAGHLRRRAGAFLDSSRSELVADAVRAALQRLE